MGVNCKLLLWTC